MHISINLAPRPFADLGPALKRLRIAMGILGLLVIGLGLGLHALHEKAEQARASEHTLDAQIAQVAQERGNYQAMMHRPDNAQLLTQADALNKLFDEKAFSWTLAMANLETVLPGGVQVSTLEPVRAKDGHITVQLRVDGPRDRSVEVVRNLEHSRRFLVPRIVGERSAVTGTGANQRLEPVSASNRFDFDLLAEYNPTSAEEAARFAKASVGAEKPGNKPSAVNQGPEFVQRGVRPPYTGPIGKPSPARGGGR